MRLVVIKTFPTVMRFTIAKMKIMDTISGNYNIDSVNNGQCKGPYVVKILDDNTHYSIRFPLFIHLVTIHELGKILTTIPKYSIIYFIKLILKHVISERIGGLSPWLHLL